MKPSPTPRPTVSDLDPGRLARLDVLFMDCDGVLTDGRVWLDELGQQSKAFSIIDGYGLVMLREAGVQLVLVTRDPSPIPRLRAARLCFHQVHQDVRDKGLTVRAVLASLGLAPEAAAFVGDDLPDLDAFEAVGLAIAPATARPAVKAAADAVTEADAGHGAVRELCDAILAARARAGR